MPASMTIDQDTLAPPGVADRARTDGLLGGELVTLTSNSHLATFRFELLWVPPSDVSSIPSLAFIGGDQWTYTPSAGVPGEHRIRLITDEGTPNEDSQELGFAIRTPNAAMVIPALNAIGDPSVNRVVAANPTLEAEAVARTTENEPYGPFPNGSYAGWQRFYEELVLFVDGLVVGAAGPPKYTVAAPFAGVGAHALLIDNFHRFSAAGVAVVFTLPPSSAPNAGQSIVLKDIGAPPASISIVPAGADTLEGVNAPYLPPVMPQGGYTLIDDGAGGWHVR